MIPFPVPHRGNWIQDFTPRKMVYGHEPETFKFYERKLQPTDKVADVGAHNGEYAPFFADRCAEVHAYEPDPTAFSKLQRATRRKKNTTCYNVAIGDKESTLSLGGEAGSGVNSLLFGHEKGKIEVQVIPLPDIFDWAKIDVEGAEHLVLAGMKRPIHCTIEFSPKNLRETGQDPATFIEEACSFGYEWYAIDDNGVEFKTTVDDLIKRTRGHTNIYLKPLSQ